MNACSAVSTGTFWSLVCEEEIQGSESRIEISQGKLYIQKCAQNIQLRTKKRGGQGTYHSRLWLVFPSRSLICDRKFEKRFCKQPNRVTIFVRNNRWCNFLQEKHSAGCNWSCECTSKSAITRNQQTIANESYRTIAARQIVQRNIFFGLEVAIGTVLHLSVIFNSVNPLSPGTCLLRISALMHSRIRAGKVDWNRPLFRSVVRFCSIKRALRDEYIINKY